MFLFLEQHCKVGFVHDNTKLCSNSHHYDRDYAVITRLLEHHYNCSAKDITKITTSEEGCLDLTGYRYLIPFVYPDFYHLPTSRGNLIVCVGDDDFSPSTAHNNLTIQHVSSHQDWFPFYDTLRYCDYVVAGDDPDSVLAAQSIRVPTLSSEDWNKVVSNNSYPERLPYFGYRNTRLDYIRANEIVSTFPFHHFQALQVQDISPMSAQATNNKTLVIVLGNIRGGDTTWASMEKHLLDLNMADLALMIGQGGSTNSSLYKRAKLIWEFEEFDDWGDAIDEMMNSSEWRTTVLKQVKINAGLFGGVEKRWSSTAISFMARFWLSQKLAEQDLISQYDTFVLTRSDLLYKCDHDLSLLERGYIHVPVGEDYGGITDRHLVCHSTQLLAAIDLYPHFLSHPDKYFKGSELMKENAEQMIRLRWIEKNLYPHYVKRFPRVMYAAATPTDTSRWMKANKDAGVNEDGVLVKYWNEYHLHRAIVEEAM